MQDRSGVDVGARAAADDEVPKPAADVAALARKAGFDVLTTYARGNGIESIAVRMRHPDSTRITAVWEKKPGKEKYGFDAALLASPLSGVSSPLLRDYLKARAMGYA